MCLAGIETEIRKLPERELPAPSKPADPDRTEPRTYRLHPNPPPETLPGTAASPRLRPAWTP
ncbi:MAG TPA: hypothetical protein VFV77_01700 [Gammaproteobacteria bacterium]|nr:hypothetical protein [Gammaproteobacteria bacterium]